MSDTRGNGLPGLLADWLAATVEMMFGKRPEPKLVRVMRDPDPREAARLRAERPRG